MSQDVRFIRKNGRVIPIRVKGGASGAGELRTKQVSTGERAKRGAVAGAKIGGTVGAASGVALGLAAGRGAKGKMLAATGLGVLSGVSGALQWGMLGAGINAAFGARERTTFVKAGNKVSMKKKR